MVREPLDPAAVEQTEAEWMYRLESGAPEHVKGALGMHSGRIGGGVVLAMRNDPVQYWNKALGFGFDAPLTGDVVAQVCDVYRSHGVARAVIQVAPSVLPVDWDDICAAQGIVQDQSWVKLVHHLDVIEPTETDLRVTRIDVGDSRRWASALLRGFGWPEDERLLGMAAAVVGRPGFQCYAAWDGEEIVGVGNAFIRGDVTAMWGAATLETHRRRGAQTALLTARLRDAKAAGCRLAVAETGVEGPGEHNPSLHNMRNVGFATQYERPNWVWRRSDEE